MIVTRTLSVKWGIGMNEPGLARKINDMIEYGEREWGDPCVGVERVTEFHWLLLFGRESKS